MPPTSTAKYATSYSHRFTTLECAMARGGRRNISDWKVLRPVVAGAEVEDQIRRERPNVYQSFSLTRLLLGIVGVLLPTVLVGWDLIADAVRGEPFTVLGSLSTYYYYPRPLRDWLVGSFWAVGLGLMVYLGNRKLSRANLISWIAGAAAILAALLPTNEAGCMPDSVTSALHAVFALMLFAGLGLLCFGFGIDDRTRTDGEPGPWKRRWIHYSAFVLIIASIVFVPTSCVAGLWPSHGILVAEVVAVYAFSISWFIKGWELISYSKSHPADRSGAPRAGSTATPEQVTSA